MRIYGLELKSVTNVGAPFVDSGSSFFFGQSDRERIDCPHCGELWENRKKHWGILYRCTYS